MLCPVYNSEYTRLSSRFETPISQHKGGDLHHLQLGTWEYIEHRIVITVGWGRANASYSTAPGCLGVQLPIRDVPTIMHKLPLPPAVERTGIIFTANVRKYLRLEVQVLFFSQKHISWVALLLLQLTYRGSGPCPCCSHLKPAVTIEPPLPNQPSCPTPEQCSTHTACEAQPRVQPLCQATVWGQTNCFVPAPAKQDSRRSKGWSVPETQPAAQRLPKGDRQRFSKSLHTAETQSSQTPNAEFKKFSLSAADIK